ncbi:MAG TPA: DUF1634 domain-containing protein [Pirellulales bacterium]|nr:DUF1634 domain-containing protein [Pirellulales bacterium]
MKDDHRELEHWVHWTLLGGLGVSAVLLLMGLIAMLAQGLESASPHEPVGRLVHDALQFRGSAVTTLGLLVLMITPIVRVVVLLVGWAARRDWLFASVALAVLSLLVFSLLHGVG